MTSQITSSTQHGYAAGDRLRLGGYSNRHRFGVSRVVSGTCLEYWHHERPSRGFAKHLRARKAAGKTNGRGR